MILRLLQQPKEKEESSLRLLQKPAVSPTAPAAAPKPIEESTLQESAQVGAARTLDLLKAVPKAAAAAFSPKNLLRPPLSPPSTSVVNAAEPVVTGALNQLNRIPEAIKGAFYPFKDKSRAESAAQAFMRPEDVPAGRVGGEFSKLLPDAHTLSKTSKEKLGVHIPAPALNTANILLSTLAGTATDVFSYEAGMGSIFSRLTKGFNAARTAERMAKFEKDLDRATEFVVGQAEKRGVYPKDWTPEDKVGRTKVELREMITGSKDPKTVLNPELGEKIMKAPTTREEAMNILRSRAPALESEAGTLKFADEPERMKSSLLAVASSKLPAKASAAQILNTLKNAGLNQEEIEFSGLPGYLNDKPNATRDEIVDYINKNKVRVEVIDNKSDNDRFSADEVRDKIALELFGDHFDNLDTTQRRDVVTEFNIQQHNEPAFSTNTKYEQYTLPGGDNYREVLVKLPEKKEVEQPDIGWIQDSPGEWTAVIDGRTFGMTQENNGIYVFEEGGVLGKLVHSFKEAKEEVNKVARGIKDEKPFRTPHFDDPNILVHLRTTDRKTADGKKILFIEEIQSDWHAKGKKEGYGTPLTQEEQAEQSRLVKEADDFTNEMMRKYQTRAYWHKVSGEESARHGRIYSRLAEIQDKARKMAVPNAPFKNTWHELALKQAIDMAVKEGYDGVAFISGQQTADRYDLSKQISEIKFHDNSSGGIGEADLVGETRAGQLLAYDMNGKEVIRKYLYEPHNELPELIGKDAAKNLLATKPTNTRIAGLGYRERSLKGQQLKVGGEWAKKFYDEIMPKAAEKYIKKWGGKVEEVGFGEPFKISNEKGEKFDDILNFKQKGFFITPQMAKEVKEIGQPLFGNRLGGSLADKLQSEKGFAGGAGDEPLPDDITGPPQYFTFLRRSHGQKIRDNEDEIKRLAGEIEKVSKSTMEPEEKLKQLQFFEGEKKFYEKSLEKLKQTPAPATPAAPGKPTSKDQIVINGIKWIRKGDKWEYEEANKPVLEKEVKTYEQEFDSLPLEEQERKALEAEGELDMKEFMKSPENNLFAAIRDLGGIKSFKTGDVMSEEMKEIPLFLRNNKGYTLDAILTDLEGTYGWKFDSADELKEAIKSFEPVSQEGKGQLRWIVKRFNKNKKMKENFIKRYVEAIGKELAKPLSATKVKSVVREATGQIKVSQIVDEKTALKEILRAQQVVSKEAFREGKITAKEEMRSILLQRKATENVRKEVNDMLDEIRKVNTDKMDPANKEVIDGIKKSLDFTVPKQKTLSRLIKTQQYIIDNPEAEIPDYVLNNLERLTKMNRDDMTVDQLRSLHTIVKHHKHLADTKDSIRVGRDVKKRIETVKQAISEMRPVKDIEREFIQSPDVKDVALKGFKESVLNSLGISQDHYDLIIESLAGEKSIMYDVLFDQIKDGLRKKLALEQRIHDVFIDEYSKISDEIKEFSKWRHERIATGKYKFTPGERISIYLHLNNINNARHLLEGGFVFKGDSARRLEHLSYADAEKILNDLSPLEKAIGDIQYKIEEIIYDELNKVHMERNGYEMPKEDNYYRIRVSTHHLDREVEEKSIIERFKNRYLRIGIGKGFTNKRVKSKAPIILEDFFEATAKYLHESATYAGLEIPLTNASRLLYDPQFRMHLVNRYGEEVWGEINKALRDIAGDYQQLDWPEKMFLHGKNVVTKVIFGLNPSAMAKQILSIPLLNLYVKSQYLVQGFADYLKNRSAIMERHKKYSPEFRNRIEGGYQRDVADVLSSKFADKLTGQPEDLATRLILTRYMDAEIVAYGIQAAVLQRLDELRGVEGMTAADKIADAYKFADYVINRTQSTAAKEHRSSLSRSGNPLAQMFTFAGTDTNQQLNILRRFWGQYQRTGDPADRDKFVKALLFIFAVVPAGNALIDYAADFLYRKKKIPEKPTIGQIILKIINSHGGLLYFVRDAVSVITSGLEHGKYQSFEITNPLFTAVEKTLRGIVSGLNALGILGSSALKGFVSGKDKKKLEKEAIAFADSMLESTLTYWKGLPYGNFKKLLGAPFREEEKKKKKKSNLRLLK